MRVEKTRDVRKDQQEIKKRKKKSEIRKTQDKRRPEEKKVTMQLET